MSSLFQNSFTEEDGGKDGLRNESAGKGSRRKSLLAHELRQRFTTTRDVDKNMNAKLIKVLQDIRDLNSTPLRRVPPKPTMLYLMELRSHNGHNGFSRRQIVIPVDMKNADGALPLQVKIKHL